jgi:hypothetical protein
MPHPFEHLAVLAAFVILTTIALTSFALNADNDLTEHQARVLCTGLKTIEHVAIAYGTVLAAQDAPLTLVVKAVMPLLR